jgi:putative transposase
MPWRKPYLRARNQRLAPELYTCANRIYFMTIRAYRNQSPFARDPLCRLALDALQQEQVRSVCSIFTYCLMPDHLHFLIAPGRDGVSVIDFTHQYKGRTTNQSWAIGWQGKLWQPRFYDHVVRKEEDLAAIASYVLLNPVRRGLVADAAQWRWSGSMNPLPL